jgi:hypothetical protein
MHHSTFRRAIARLGRNALFCLPALALTLTLGTAIVIPPPDDTTSVMTKPTVAPQVNWNS